MSLELIEDLGYLYAKSSSKQKCRFGLYKCFCGNEFKALISNVKVGNTNSCGCLQKAKTKESNTIHGLYKNKIYKAWKSMIQRCADDKQDKYKNYGARGITVCNEWKNDFLLFYNWAINNGYIEGLSIDRINNDGNYEPINCRWTTKNVQSRNTRIIRANNTSGYRGVHWNKKDKIWVAQITINSKTVYLGTFLNAIEAAKGYDKYVIDNNLEHNINFKIKGD